MDPIIGGALIGAGASVVGGLIGSNSAASQARMQKQFAQHGIRWRVRDAKKAGLHPLYALGAQVPAYSPVSSPLGDSLAQAGQQIGSAVAARLTPHQQRIMNLELAQAEANLAKTDEERAYIRSERLRNIVGSIQFLPEANISEKGGQGTVFGGQAVHTSRGVPSDMVTPKAPDLPSATTADPGVIAGTAPLMREFKMPGSGLPIMLPGGVSGDASEALESITESPIVMWSVFNTNWKRYGDEWARRFVREHVVGTVYYDYFARNLARAKRQLHWKPSVISQDPQLWKR